MEATVLCASDKVQLNYINLIPSNVNLSQVCFCRSKDESRSTLDGHACLKAMCFYWIWDGPLFIYLVTDKTVSWDWSGCFSICTIFTVATATVEIHIYFAFYWDILMLREANWSREICKNCRFFGRWKTTGGHFDSRLGHVNSSAPIRRGVDCFTVSKLQCTSSSFNHCPPIHCLLTLNSTATETYTTVFPGLLGPVSSNLLRIHNCMHFFL